MYLAISHFQFVDNKARPNTVGCLLNCSLLSACLSGAKTLYTGRTTIADLLLGAGKTFTTYAEGYADAASARASNCPSIASSCQYSIFSNPVAQEACRYEASDIPFNYYSQFANGAQLGRSPKRGVVSHVQVEHSSVVRFLDYNFIGKVGQLGYNDAKVANIGSMLDAKAVGFAVPES